MSIPRRLKRTSLVEDWQYDEAAAEVRGEILERKKVGVLICRSVTFQ